jgi:tryptophanyl-tRNA synthetase
MRDLAGRFNHSYGATFVLPEAWIPKMGAKIMSLDDPTRKMSKSDMDVRPTSGINLVEDPDSIRKKIRSAVTDSGHEIRATEEKPALSNLLTIYSLAEGSSVAEIEARVEGQGYGEFKAALAETLIDHLAPIRQRYEELVGDLEELSRYLKMGATRASEVAESTLAEVREAVGLVASP